MTPERWQKFSKEKQLLNIAAELSRTKFWLERKDESRILSCLNRALELLDLTINGSRQQRDLKELLLFREVLSQFYVDKNKNIHQFKKILKTLLFLNKFTSLVKI
jgi:hypothetical protein